MLVVISETKYTNRFSPVPSYNMHLQYNFFGIRTIMSFTRKFQLGFSQLRLILHIKKQHFEK